MAQPLRLVLTLAVLCLVVHAALGFVIRGKNKLEGSSHRTRSGPYHLDLSHQRRSSNDEEQPVRVRRTAGSPIVFHIPLNDSDPYGLIDYAGSVVFILIYNLAGTAVTSTRLYRGTVYGEEITSISGQLDPNDTNPLLSTNFHVSDEDYNIVAFPHATLGQMYLSHDRGLTFEKVVFSPPTISTSSLSWYPMDHDWMLGLDRQNNRLYASNNTGTSWTLVANNVADFTWGDPTIDLPHTVYYSVYDPIVQTSGSITVRLYRQQLPFSSPQPPLEFDPTLGLFGSFVLAGHYIFTQTTNSLGDLILYVSYKRRPFQLASFPPIHVQNYYFYDVNNIQALALLVDGSGQMNVYTSDSTGVNYTLSLADVYYYSNYIDFDRINGVNGTIVANQYVRSDPTQPHINIRTVITFNNGGQWSLIQAPGVDVYGNAISCSLPACSLNLFMDTSQYSTLGVYSQSQATGLIAAHGSLGQYRGGTPDLYMSRDGGITWFQALPSSWGLTFLDHGNLIVAAKDYHQRPSGVMKYSTDEGLHWQDFSFSPNVAYIYGVIGDPLEVTANVCLFGVEDNTYSWVVWNIDFEYVFPRQCVGGDYYTWSAGCRLGYQLKIQRKLNNVTCLNGPVYSPNISSTNCSCSLADYECAYGYNMPKYPTTPAGSCARDTTILSSCRNESGYQKIPGDICWGNYYIAPLQCYPANGGSSSATDSTNGGSSSATDSTNGSASDSSTVVAAVVSVIIIIVIIGTATLAVLGGFLLCRMGSHHRTTTSGQFRETYRKKDEAVSIPIEGRDSDKAKILEDS